MQVNQNRQGFSLMLQQNVAPDVAANWQPCLNIWQPCSFIPNDDAQEQVFSVPHWEWSWAWWSQVTGTQGKSLCSHPMLLSPAFCVLRARLLLLCGYLSHFCQTLFGWVTLMEGSCAGLLGVSGDSHVIHSHSSGKKLRVLAWSQTEHL